MGDGNSLPRNSGAGMLSELSSKIEQKVIEQKVYVVDDDIIIRILLEQVFRNANLAVETYSSAEDFLLSYDSRLRGCLVLDNLMPGMNGVELQEVLAAHGNTAPVIFLTGAGDVSIAVRALKGGAIDFLEKPVEPGRMLRSVTEALELDRKNEEKRLKGVEAKRRMALLTPREYEVMEWLYQGKPNKVIGQILGISGRTVEIHRKKVFEKIRVDSVADLIQMVLLARS